MAILCLLISFWKHIFKIFLSFFDTSIFANQRLTWVHSMHADNESLKMALVCVYIYVFVKYYC